MPNSAFQELFGDVSKLKSKVKLDSIIHRKSVHLSESSSSCEIQAPKSEEDDKADPRFMIKDSSYYNLPEAVRNAIDRTVINNKHSNFYYTMYDFNCKVNMYNNMFNKRIPYFEKVWMRQ